MPAIVKILGAGFLAGLSNVLLVQFAINPHTKGLKTDEVINTMPALNFWVGWTVFMTFFVVKVYEEWRATEEAVNRRDWDAFIVEAKKKVHVFMLTIYGTASILLLATTWIFNYKSIWTVILYPGGTAFIVMVVTCVIVDMDDPLEGPLHIKIPKSWRERLATELNKQEEEEELV